MRGGMVRKRADRMAGGGRKGRFHVVEKWVPWCGKWAKTGSMAWKFFENLLPWRGKTAKMTSMAWKIPQSDDSQRGAGGQGGRIRVPWRGSFVKSGFHGVEKRHNSGSRAWKGMNTRMMFAATMVAMVAAGCASVRFANDPNVVFVVEDDWDGNFTLRQLQGVGVDERALDFGVKSPSGKYSAVVECPFPDVSEALNVDIMALADDGTVKGGSRLVDGRDIRGIVPHWFKTFAGDVLVFYVQNDTHATSLFAVRPDVVGNSVTVQLLYFSAPSFVEDFYDHRYVDEKSISVSYDGILTYTMWCSSQDGQRDRTYNVSVPLAFTWGKRIEGRIDERCDVPHECAVLEKCIKGRNFILEKTANLGSMAWKTKR